MGMVIRSSHPAIATPTSPHSLPHFIATPSTPSHQSQTIAPPSHPHTIAPPSTPSHPPTHLRAQKLSDAGSQHFPAITLAGVRGFPRPLKLKLPPLSCFIHHLTQVAGGGGGDGKGGGGEGMGGGKGRGRGCDAQ